MRTCRTCKRQFTPIANQQYCGEPCVSPTMAKLEKKGGVCRGCGSRLEDGRFQYCGDACRPAKPKREPRKAVAPRVCRCGAVWTPRDAKVKTMLCVGCREALRETHVYSTKKAWRNAVRNRAQGRCEKCGASEQDSGMFHHAHHLVARCEGGLNTLSNGKLLCIDCHDDAHGGRALGGTVLSAHRSSVDLVDQIAERVVEMLKREALV